MIKANFSSVTLSDGSIFWGIDDEYIFTVLKSGKQFYELRELDKFRKYVPSNPIIYDIGANIGNHTIYFKKYYDANKIYSFEPVPANFELLNKNIQENNLKNIELLNVGVSDSFKKASIIFNEKNMGECKLYESPSGNIEVIPIDGQTFDAPDLIKIDVEGDELNVLKGMSKILELNKPVLWIEIINNNFDEVDDFLSSLNYELVDKLNFNHLYLKTGCLEDRAAILDRFKKNTVIESNQLITDKWNLNKWLNNSKDTVKKLESDIVSEREIAKEKEQHFAKILETIISHPLFKITSGDSQISSKTNVTSIDVLALDILNKLHEVHSSSTNLNSALSDKNQQLEVQKLKVDNLCFENNHLNNQILIHIDEEKKLLFEIKRINDHYQLIERRYMRLRNSLFGKIGVKLWKIFKKLRKR
ncbi:FkbM family methyltransferase [Paenibacillus sp. FSL R5-0407]|uniref:FkbM family methyltransferase n=1 Tax=Paenibacillus sp. FSL R5-0407 TaxID=2975320 RepID=UPI0030FC887C